MKRLSFYMIYCSIDMFALNEHHVDLIRQRRQRKRLLFSCACFRQIWNSLDEKIKTIIALAEQYADDLITQEQFNQKRTEILNGSFWERFCNAFSLKKYKHFESAVKLLSKERVEPCCWQLVKEISDSKETYRFQDSLLNDLFDYYPIERYCCYFDKYPYFYSNQIKDLAQVYYDTQDQTARLVLSDALEEHGCHQSFYNHLRIGNHYKGCWVIDQILEKNDWQVKHDR